MRAHCADFEKNMNVTELRVVLTVENYARAVAFYRDTLGLAEAADYSSPDGRVTLLEAGRATIEIADARQADFIDQVEAGRRVAGPIPFAFEVDDSAEVANRLAAAGATIMAGPTVTPWRDRNVRLDPPDGVQLTLFTVLGDAPIS
jgi:catechol 2,3-dioxygenase-like lactoylglutathione lyase family enzyme